MTDTAPDLLFDLTLTDEQRMNRESMQRFAAAEIRTQAKPVDEGAAVARDFFPKTAELGLTLLPIPEALGGAGVERSPTSNALIFEDLAHGDMALTLGATGGSISIYAYASYDGTEYTGGLDGADGTVTWGTTPSTSIVDGYQALVLLGVVGTENADDDKYVRWGPFSIAQAFGGTVPPKWGIVIKNNTLAALHATQTSSECQYTGVTFTST